MTNEQKRYLGYEVLHNMDLTKEQYIELCKMCDELDLVPKLDESIEPEDMTWVDILNENAE